MVTSTTTPTSGAERYGRDLIGPPTFAEYFSLNLQDLLLSKGNQMPDRNELFLAGTSDSPKVKINDYWNSWHRAFPRDNWTDYSSTAEQYQGFYEEGHIPILGVESRMDDAPTLKICRPKDVIRPSLAEEIFLKGLPERVLKGTQVRIIVSSTKEELEAPLQNPLIQEIQSHF